MGYLLFFCGYLQVITGHTHKNRLEQNRVLQYWKGAKQSAMIECRLMVQFRLTSLMTIIIQGGYTGCIANLSLFFFFCGLEIDTLYKTLYQK